MVSKRRVKGQPRGLPATQPSKEKASAPIARKSVVTKVVVIDRPSPTPPPNAQPSRPSRVFQWIKPAGGKSATISQNAPAAVILDHVSPTQAKTATGLPHLLGPAHAQRATHEDTFPAAPPARPAPDFFPGVLGELQQAPVVSSDNQSALSYETNMAAFESQDPWGSRPTSANIGYSSVKGSFRR